MNILFIIVNISEDSFSGHKSPPIILTIEPRMVTIF